jgi:biopolymer transport protein ExbB/TolQ
VSRTAKILMIAGGLLLVLGPAAGLLGTVLGMVRAFDATSEGGAADASEVAAGVNTALLTTAVGLPVGLVGLVLLVVGLIVGLKGQKASNAVTQ